jgi:hypothetical protein
MFSSVLMFPLAISASRGGRASLIDGIVYYAIIMSSVNYILIISLPLRLGQTCTRPDLLRALRLACRVLLLVSCLTYTWTVNVDRICSSETSDCLQTTRRYNQEDRTLLFHSRDTLKFNILRVYFLKCSIF